MVYRFLRGDTERSPRIGDYIPTCYLYDDQNCVLVLEFLRGAETMTEYHRRVKRFPKGLATKLGSALGKLHRYGESRKTELSHAPWVLSALQLPHIDLLRDISGANMQLIRIVQRYPEYCQMLDALLDRWTATTLIHGDLKWENCIVFPNPEGKGNRLNIVDWELASAGDPCWDAGSVFADYLSYWIFSMPVSGDSMPSDFIPLARWPITMMQPAIVAFWASYVTEMGLDRKIEGRMLEKEHSVRWWQNDANSFRTSAEFELFDWVGSLSVAAQSKSDETADRSGYPAVGVYGWKCVDYYSEQLKTAIDATTIISSWEFAWMGRTEHQFPVNARKDLRTDKAERYLAFALQSRLYDSFYCRGIAAAVDETVSLRSQSGQVDFLENLSRANQGSGSWEPGWTCQPFRDSEFIAVRNGLI